MTLRAHFDFWTIAFVVLTSHFSEETPNLNPIKPFPGHFYLPLSGDSWMRNTIYCLIDPANQLRETRLNRYPPIEAPKTIKALLIFRKPKVRMRLTEAISRVRQSLIVSFPMT